MEVLVPNNSITTPRLASAHPSVVAPPSSSFFAPVAGQGSSFFSQSCKHGVVASVGCTDPNNPSITAIEEDRDLLKDVLDVDALSLLLEAHDSMTHDDRRQAFREGRIHTLATSSSPSSAPSSSRGGGSAQSSDDDDALAELIEELASGTQPQSQQPMPCSTPSVAEMASPPSIPTLTAPVPSSQSQMETDSPILGKPSVPTARAACPLPAIVATVPPSSALPIVDDPGLTPPPPAADVMDDDSDDNARRTRGERNRRSRNRGSHHSSSSSQRGRRPSGTAIRETVQPAELVISVPEMPSSSSSLTSSPPLSTSSSSSSSFVGSQQATTIPALIRSSSAISKTTLGRARPASLMERQTQLFHSVLDLNDSNSDALEEEHRGELVAMRQRHREQIEALLASQLQAERELRKSQKKHRAEWYDNVREQLVKLI